MAIPAFLLGACSGAIPERAPGPGEEPPETGGKGGASGQMRGGNGGGPMGTGGAAGMTGTPAACTVKPSPAYLRRLSNAEYERTVRDLLGQEVIFPSNTPADTPLHGFDNNKATLTISTAHVANYAAMAEAVAGRFLSGAGDKAALLGCAPPGANRADCLAKVIDGFGRRAYRRALTADERAAYMKLAEAANGDPDPLAAFRLVLTGFLQSPSFLYRVEVGTPDPARPGAKRLTGFEVATRLSYLLWGTTPSDALLDKAAKKELDTPEGVEAAAKEMLGDARARFGLERFYAQMVRLPELDRLERDAKVFTTWSKLRPAMAEETRRLLADHVWTDGANFLDVLTAQHTFVDATLAKHYGLPAPATAWEKTSLESRPERRGLLTNGSILSLTAHTEVTAPIVRGSWIREVILCAPLPPPPEGVPPAPESTEGKSVRQILAEHGKGSCAGCHAALDPVGFGLERFDVVGAYREKDPEGRPLTGEGRLDGAANPAFVGAVELAERLRAMPETSACAVKHLFRYTFGREEGDGDTCAMSSLAKVFADAKGDLRKTLLTMVRSDVFRYVGGAQ